MSKMLVHSAADRVGVSACGLRGLASKRISTVTSKITCRRCRKMRGLDCAPRRDKFDGVPVPPPDTAAPQGATSPELQNVYAAFYATARSEALLKLFREHAYLGHRDPFNRAGIIALHMRNRSRRATDDELRNLWREAGGDFHGPNVETATMPEALLFPLLRLLLQI